MITAPPLVVDGDHGHGHTVTRCVVAVHRAGICHSTAVCSCGWRGRRRLLVAAAEQDAWGHAIDAGCDVSFPLVFSG